MNPHTAEQPRPAPLPRTIVTGASSGIGRTLALHLASLGVPVVALGRDAVRMQSLAAQHLLIHAWPVDLARIGEIDALAQQIVARFPDLGVLIHNAGIQHDLRMDDTGHGSADIQQEVDVNLVAPIALTRALLPHLQSRQQAFVVNVTSALAHAPKRTAAVYSATKAGLRLFTQALRVQQRAGRRCGDAPGGHAHDAGAGARQAAGRAGRPGAGRRSPRRPRRNSHRQGALGARAAALGAGAARAHAAKRLRRHNALS